MDNGRKKNALPDSFGWFQMVPVGFGPTFVEAMEGRPAFVGLRRGGQDFFG